MVKLLINFGAKIDACNPEGLTALHAAARMQNVECAKCADTLLACGADIDNISSNEHPPLMTAIIHNHAMLRLFTG